MKRFIISPPFSHLISHPKCTRVFGTYTLHRRGGWLKKLYRIATTLKAVPGGWVNNVGLQNPGIADVKKFEPRHIYSITAIDPEDWGAIIGYIPQGTIVELNLGCPNVHTQTTINDEQVAKYLAKFPDAIFKLAATDNIYHTADRLISLGAKYLHIANTIPTTKGGESGNRLKVFSLTAIRQIKSQHPTVTIIGGGGIYTKADIEAYAQAGATYFSLATIWLRPWQALQLLRRE